MARLDSFISILLSNEAVLDPKYYSLPFEKQFAIAKKRGWANDPDDSGGATMCGITLKTYRLDHPGATKDDLRNISFSDWYTIVKRRFWDRWMADEIKNQSVANFVVDWLFNSGSFGIKIPQEVLGVLPDGIVGRKTLDALNAKNQLELLKKLKERRIVFFESIIKKNPTQAKFKKSWFSRINRIN